MTTKVVNECCLSFVIWVLSDVLIEIVALILDSAISECKQFLRKPWDLIQRVRKGNICREEGWMEGCVNSFSLQTSKNRITVELLVLDAEGCEFNDSLILLFEVELRGSAQELYSDIHDVIVYVTHDSLEAALTKRRCLLFIRVQCVCMQCTGC